jgi:hypothetical protein
MKEMKADINANIEARQERANAELKAAQAEIEARAEARHERFLAFLDSLTSYGKERRPVRQRQRLVQKKWTLRIWKLRWKQQSPQWSGRISLRKRRTSKISGHRRTDAKNNAWLCDVAEEKRSGPKTVLGPGRRCLLPASESYAAPSLQFEREIFARVQARTVLREEPLREGGSRRHTGSARNAVSALGTEA